MRPAANAWERDYALKLVEEKGFSRSMAAPATFVQKDTGVRLVVWGDDATFLRRSRDVEDMGIAMSEWYQVKLRGVMGPESQDVKSIGSSTGPSSGSPAS